MSYSSYSDYLKYKNCKRDTVSCHNNYDSYAKYNRSLDCCRAWWTNDDMRKLNAIIPCNMCCWPCIAKPCPPPPPPKPKPIPICPIICTTEYIVEMIPSPCEKKKEICPIICSTENITVQESKDEHNEEECCCEDEHNEEELCCEDKLNV